METGPFCGSPPPTTQTALRPLWSRGGPRHQQARVPSPLTPCSRMFLRFLPSVHPPQSFLCWEAPRAPGCTALLPPHLLPGPGPSGTQPRLAGTGARLGISFSPAPLLPTSSLPSSAALVPSHPLFLESFVFLFFLLKSPLSLNSRFGRSFQGSSSPAEQPPGRWLCPWAPSAE